MAPLGVHVDNLQENSIIVRFTPVPPSHHGGDLQGYNVYYKNTQHHHEHDDMGGKVTISPHETQTIIYGLETMQQYQVSVSAYNNEDEGPRSEWQEIVIGKVPVLGNKLYCHSSSRHPGV